MRGFQITIWAILLTVITSCGSSVENPIDKPLRIESVSDQEKEAQINLEVNRFDEDFFAITKASFIKDTTLLYEKYGSFVDLFTGKIIRLGGKNFPMFSENILGFINDPDIQSVYKEVKKQYPSLEEENKDLSIAMTRYHLVFPDSLIPQVNAMISGFNYNIAISDSTLAIGLDMYLGDSCRFYELLALPAYKTKRMNRNYLVTDAVKGFVLATFPNEAKEEDLISRMIYEGKMIYFISQLLPQYSAASVMTYTEAELEWCKKNEGKIWSHFIDRKLFYTRDFNNEVAYVSDGPFTKGFPQEAPPRIGVWLGLQIVKSFMEKNAEISLPQLIQMNDAHKLFNTSGYKPVRS
ncbi:MAG: hypothetical protein WED33_06905 [Bacteroidia bacterium]